MTPPWVQTVGDDGAALRVIATAPLPSGDLDAPIDLTIRRVPGGVTVGETVVGTRLPERCPELHVVDGGTFCLGIEEDTLDDPNEAERFWNRLGDYLRNQRYAERHRRWPAGRWLSHGAAAAGSQLEAERIAAECGWAEEYADAIENGRGWLAEELPRPAKHGGLVNARTPCPRGCRRRDGAPVLRRSCSQRAALERLVLAERERRAAGDRFIESLRRDGLACCGRVDGCPLAA
ncbi:MAG: hypothetical protein PGN23_06805 [Sphingomonas adhaesiva]|uniref:E2 domain-containing protein n=1 Tax=Sphingomonas adhaesiva TaxID=28212 RepID=UPI002FFB85B1